MREASLYRFCDTDLGRWAAARMLGSHISSAWRHRHSPRWAAARKKRTMKTMHVWMIMPVMCGGCESAVTWAVGRLQETEDRVRQALSQRASARAVSGLTSQEDPASGSGLASLAHQLALTLKEVAEEGVTGAAAQPATAPPASATTRLSTALAAAEAQPFCSCGGRGAGVGAKTGWAQGRLSACAHSCFEGCVLQAIVAAGAQMREQDTSPQPLVPIRACACAFAHHRTATEVLVHCSTVFCAAHTLGWALGISAGGLQGGTVSLLPCNRMLGWRS
eukprot:1159684-Pelagomonas_calceolata.AAC.5